MNLSFVPAHKSLDYPWYLKNQGKHPWTLKHYTPEICERRRKWWPPRTSWGFFHLLLKAGDNIDKVKQATCPSSDGYIMICSERYISQRGIRIGLIKVSSVLWIFFSLCFLALLWHFHLFKSTLEEKGRHLSSWLAAALNNLTAQTTWTYPILPSYPQSQPHRVVLLLQQSCCHSSALPKALKGQELNLFKSRRLWGHRSAQHRVRIFPFNQQPRGLWIVKPRI